MSSTRFAVATHVLTALAYREGGPVPSARLAESVNTSPAVIRQLLMRLREAGLVDSKFGPGGGAVLTRPPNEISLLDVWRATENDHIVSMHRNEPSCDCRVGRNILCVLGEVTERAERALFEELDASTIEDMLQEVELIE